MKTPKLLGIILAGIGVGILLPVILNGIYITSIVGYIIGVCIIVGIVLTIS